MRLPLSSPSVFRERCLKQGVVWMILYAFVFPFTLAACGGEAETADVEPAPKVNAEAQAIPTKELLVALLREMNEALDRKDYKGAVALLRPFPSMSADEMEKAVAGFQSRDEISEAGIALLETGGKFGKLTEVFPRRGEHFAKKAGADAAACYAISLDDAEVAAQWDGKVFRLIRLDDVGKLK